MEERKYLLIGYKDCLQQSDFNFVSSGGQEFDQKISIEAIQWI